MNSDYGMNSDCGNTYMACTDSSQRRENVHPLLPIIKKLSAVGTCWQRKNQLSLMASKLGDISHTSGLVNTK